MTIPLRLQESLRVSITSGSFVDTKFWVFSKRGSTSERIGEPKALFVNAHIVKRVPRLGSLLDERETKENLRTGFPANRNPYTSSYDYADDSDLEEDDDEDTTDDESADPPQAVTEPSGCNSDIVILENSDVKGNESPDIASISDLDSLFSESSDAKGETGATSSAHVGKVVVVEDVAFVTFRALLRYLYTEEIEFAPWGSTERRKTRALEKISGSYGIPKPSPKSVYRLADKYDVPELKELALRQIQQDLSKCNIAEELFSRYTSWYPELRELELRQLARALLSSDSGHTLGLLKTKIKSYTHGQLPHAEPILPALYELMESGELIKETPLPVAASSNRQAAGGDWDGLKKALTRSLTSGTFLDSQFYAVQSRTSTGSPKVRPVYFCSAVGGNFTSMLVAYSSKLRARRAPPRRLTDGYDSDIDDETPDPEGYEDSYPCSKFVQENPIAASLSMEPALLLKSGAVKTWSSIFLCVYIGQITFAALSSQVVAPSEKEEIQDGCSQREPPHGSKGIGFSHPGAIAVEPCSPKSIYWLANKVGLTGLCDIAFKDIRSKLDENNIVQELFSPFAANHKRIREMEYELFQSKLKPSVDGALVSDIIRSSSSGENSHRMAAMELLFERSIQARRDMVMKDKVSLRLDPTPWQPVTTEPLNVFGMEKQSPITRPPSESLPKAVTDPAPASVKCEASQDSPAPSEPANRIKKGAQREDPPADTVTNASSSEGVVDLACPVCYAVQPRKFLRSGVYCHWCFMLNRMKCADCGTIRVTNVEACTKCHKKFK